MLYPVWVKFFEFFYWIGPNTKFWFFHFLSLFCFCYCTIILDMWSLSSSQVMALTLSAQTNIGVMGGKWGITFEILIQKHLLVINKIIQKQ